jgi:hypothetical protein
MKLASIGFAMMLSSSLFGFQAAGAFKGFTAEQDIYTNCEPPKPCSDPQTRQIIARRADGSMSLTTWEKNDPNFPFSKVILQGNQRIELRPSVKGKSTFGIPAANITRMEGAQLDPATGCTARKDKGEILMKSPNIKGEIVPNQMVDIGDGSKVKASLKTIETPISTSKSWYAVDYACFEVKQEFVRKPVKAAAGQTTIHLTKSIKASEPDAEAFTVPADYVEMKPTELRKATFLFSGKQHGKNDADLQKEWAATVESNSITFEQDDKRYLESRTAAGLK